MNLKAFSSGRRAFFSEYGEGSGNKGEDNSETGSEDETDKENDSSDDVGDDSDTNKECDFDPSLDFSKIDDNDFDPSLDFSKIDDNAFDPSLDFSKIDDNAFEPSLDFSKIDDNAFEPSLDFDKMEEIQDGDEFGPIGDPDGSQELESDGSKDGIDDHSRSSEQGDESYENLNSESTSTVLVSETGEEEIEIPPEELQDDSEPIVNTEEIEFIKEIEELAKFARETKDEDEKLEPQAEKETAAFHAEKYYEKLKEKEVENKQNSNEEQKIEEIRQEMTEESENLEEINETSNELTNTEEFEYLWNIRKGLDQEGKFEEEIKEIMHEAEEIYKTLKEAEKLYEGQQQEKLKLVDHEDEASEEDLKEDLDRVDLIEQAVEIEENLLQQGKSQEEINVKVEEAIERIELDEDLEKLHEQQEQEKSKLGNLEDEENIENLKEDLDRVDLIEQAIELEENLIQQEKSQKEIDMKVEKAIEETIETSEFEETLEKLYEEQEHKKLKLAELEDEERVEILKEDLDRVDLIEQSVELEEKLIQQEKSQEEIDMKVEEAIEETIEATNSEEKLDNISKKENSSTEHCVQIEQTSSLHNGKKAETYANVENKEKFEKLKPELRAIERESEDNKDLLEETTKRGNEESDKEENEQLQELYRQQTGKRPIYAKKRTKGYIQWLEQRELESEKIRNSQSESETNKEIEEEDWKTTLKQWIKEASEDECSAELKSELKKALESYNEFEYLTRKFLELFEKSQYEKLSEKEKNILNTLTERLQEFDSIRFELLANVRAIKKYITEQYWYDFWNRPLVNRVLSKFFYHISQKYNRAMLESEDFKYTNQKINLRENNNIFDENLQFNKSEIKVSNQEKALIREEFSKSDESLPHIQPFKADILAIQALQLGILTIYYICEIFPKNSEIDKKFFSGSELNYILDKHSQFFYTINKNLKDKDLIRYFGTVTRKKKSNEKIYIITEKGIKFTEEIIEIKRRDFPILFDELISTLEKRYIEYLINSENKIIIRLQKDIIDELRKKARDNNVELVASYRSDHLDIKFRCKKCKKQFKDTFRLIKSRKDPKLFCPYCFPELKTNIYLSEKLKVQISKFTFTELRKTTLHKLSKNKILDIIEYIKKLVFNFIEPQIIERKTEFKEFIEKYICSIVGFLTEVKRLYETNQFINLSKISLLFHDKGIVSESMWQAVCRTIIKYLREDFNFNIRTKRYDSLPKSIRQSIRNYINLYKLILGVDRSGNIITYMDIDFKTEIKIHYDGKCQGINGYCPFDIDYRFLPALSFDHRLEKYNTIVKRKGFKYILPKTMLGGSFNKALAKMKSQIGGMDLKCRNCHSSKHHNMYYFLPIFNFLKSLHIRDVDVNTTYVLDSVNLLAKKYFEYAKKSMKLSNKYTQAQILGRIRNQIFRLIKKKYVIEYLFGANYICPGCQKANINEHLTCFEAHHTNETIFENGAQKITFSTYYSKAIKWLIKNLITQECIYVCRNCHTITTAKNYNESTLIILENKMDASYINDFYENLHNQVNKKIKVIAHWKSQLKYKIITIPDPFLKMFNYGESIYSALISIYYICNIFSKDSKKVFFTAEELNYIQGRSSSYFKQYQNDLVELDYIQYEKRLLQYNGFNFNKDIYRITSKGMLKAIEKIEENIQIFPDEFKKLIFQWEQNSRTYHTRKQRLSTFDLSLIVIYFISNKDKIDYFLNAFHYIIDKENTYYSKHRMKLLDLEYITEIQRTANSFKEIYITQKGIERAEVLISLIKREDLEKYQKLNSDWEKKYNNYVERFEKIDK